MTVTADTGTQRREVVVIGGGQSDLSHEQHGDADGIEWEDDMVDVNRITTPANMHWSFVDRETGAANHAIDWRFRVGDQVKLRLVNEMDSDLLLDVTNPGRWMAHCHIAEHHESGMMFSFNVDPADAD